MKFLSRVLHSSAGPIFVLCRLLLLAASGSREEEEPPEKEQKGREKERARRAIKSCDPIPNDRVTADVRAIHCRAGLFPFTGRISIASQYDILPMSKPAFGKRVTNLYLYEVFLK